MGVKVECWLGQSCFFLLIERFSATGGLDMGSTLSDHHRRVKQKAPTWVGAQYRDHKFLCLDYRYAHITRPLGLIDMMMVQAHIQAVHVRSQYINGSGIWQALQPFFEQASFRQGVHGYQ